MKKATTTAMIALAALGLAACSDSTGLDGAAGLFSGIEIEGEWRGQIPVGDVVEIKGISGNIVASAAPGQELTVTWTKHGTHYDPATVTVEVIQHAEGVTICAVYPDVPGELPNECGPGNTGHMATRGVDVAVDFVVLVPTGVDFSGRTISGDVEISTAGLAEASTISGSISASIGRTDWDRDLEFSAVSGNVSVSVPGNTNAEVWATAVSGTVSSDFDLPRLTDGSLRGNIGNGGGLLRLSTVAGSVKLRKIN